jgi:uncharacterized protein YifE (UPF0438 family)
MPPPQNSRRPPPEFFNLKGKALAKALTKRAEKGDGEPWSRAAAVNRFALDLMRLYEPEPNGLCVPVGHPVLNLMVDYVFSEQAYSKKGNLVMQGPTTLENFGSKLKDMARASRFPYKEEGEAFVATFNPERGVLPFADVAYQPYVDRAHRFLVEANREHDLASFVMLRKNLRPTNLCNVYIAASHRDGEGVFAQRDLKRGDLITLHPCDYISLNLGTKTAWLPAKPDAPSVTVLISKMLVQYSAHVEGTCISIAADPTIPANPTACAHLINDGAELEDRDFDYRAMYKYTEDTARAQNCHFITLAGAVVAAVASRDIKRNEEIYAVYGAPFWANVLSQ